MDTPILSHAALLNSAPGGDGFEDVTQIIELATQGEPFTFVTLLHHCSWPGHESEAMQAGDIVTMQHFTMTDAMNAIEVRWFRCRVAFSAHTDDHR